MVNLSTPALGRPYTRSVWESTYSNDAELEPLTPASNLLSTSERFLLSDTLSSLKFGASGCLLMLSRTLGREPCAPEMLPLTPGPQPLTFALTVMSLVFLPLWP